MKRLLTLLALVLCSCAETFVGEKATRPNNENLPDLTASFADEDTTRTYVENNKYLRWHEDDRLTAFYGNTLNRQYKFNGKTGDNSGTFSLVPSGELGTDNGFDHIYALYPYNADARITDEGVISLTLPTTQTCAENSFGRGANTMLAVTENVEDTFLSFKNACGYLKLKLYNAEGATIKSIEVKGNSGERLAGATTATIAFGEVPVLAMADDATTSVTLDCGEGVAIGTTAETATEFWFVLPATTFAEGLTITATDTEGGVFEKSTTNEVIIERNAIQPMAALEAECTPTGPADNEIWYTATTKVEPTFDDFLTFGSDVVSNVWDSETKRGIITFDGDVTMIGDNAFNNCDKFTGITLPESVTSIGKNAFYDCDGLTEVIIPDSVTTIGNSAFYDCYKLTSVTIGDSVTTIGYVAFGYCSSLTSVTIGDSVTTIDYEAFRGCSSLQEFKGKFASEDGRCLIIDGLLNSFARAGLTEYTIPDSVTTIGSYAFYNCTSLTSVNIPDSVTSIGGSAFYNCTSLTSVTIPDSVTTIGNYAFYNCSSLKKVYCNATIPPSLSDSVFSYNATGRRIYVYEECVEVYKSAWSSYKDSIYTNGQNCPDTTTIEYATTDGNTITSSKLPIISNSYDNGVGTMVISGIITVIPNYAFYSCSSLTSVTIPDSVTTIGYEAFYQCTSLTSVTIPDSITTIGERAFRDCSSLTSVIIPDSVTTIGNQAFYKCSSLTSVYCKPTTPPAVTIFYSEWNAFDYNASGRKIYVPMESVEAYKSAEHWKIYAGAIVGYDF